MKISVPGFVLALLFSVQPAMGQIGQYPCRNMGLPGGDIACLAELQTDDPLGSRTPLVLVHGWNSEAFFAKPKIENWDQFITYYLNDRALQERFKIYFFLYYSNVVSVSDLGALLRDEVNKKSASDPVFASRRIVILAYSLGGLVSRSYVEEYGGGERVVKLITLGTPHHGSPLANEWARDYLALRQGLPALTLLLFDRLFYTFGPNSNQVNRSDLCWDNYDELLNYLLFPGERNQWLENLNRNPVYQSKITAYGGTFAPGPNCDSFSQFQSFCYGSTILGSAMGLANDGIVPLSSASFHDVRGISRVANRIFDGYNHEEIIRGKGDGVLFQFLRQDLLSSALSLSGVLKIRVSGRGTVTVYPDALSCTGNCSYNFAVGKNLTLKPVPQPDYVFNGWYGHQDCYDGQITIDEDTISCEADFSYRPEPLRPAANTPDFNGDGRDEIFSYNPTTGEWEISYTYDYGQFRYQRGQWSGGWTVQTAKYDSADGFTDLFLYNPTTGHWAKATSDGNGGFTYFVGQWSPGWETYVLDLNDDEVSDVFLYQPVTGAWFKCVSLKDGSGEFVYYSGQWSPGWRIYPVHLNTDWSDELFFADLFLYNPLTGQWFMVFNNGFNNPAGFTYFGGQWSPGWEVYPGNFGGAAQYDDFFLYNPVTGQWVMAINDGRKNLAYYSGSWSPGWSVKVGDFDGNGRHDVFLYNIATLQWYQALSVEAANLSPTAFGGFVYRTGYLANVNDKHLFLFDFNGDGLTDLLRYNSATGYSAQSINQGGGVFRDYQVFIGLNRMIVEKSLKRGW